MHPFEAYWRVLQACAIAYVLMLVLNTVVELSNIVKG